MQNGHNELQIVDISNEENDQRIPSRDLKQASEVIVPAEGSSLMGKSDIKEVRYDNILKTKKEPNSKRSQRLSASDRVENISHMSEDVRSHSINREAMVFNSSLSQREFQPSLNSKENKS